MAVIRRDKCHLMYDIWTNKQIIPYRNITNNKYNMRLWMWWIVSKTHENFKLTHAESIIQWNGDTATVAASGTVK